MSGFSEVEVAMVTERIRSQTEENDRLSQEVTDLTDVLSGVIDTSSKSTALMCKDVQLSAQLMSNNLLVIGLRAIVVSIAQGSDEEDREEMPIEELNELVNKAQEQSMMFCGMMKMIREMGFKTRADKWIEEAETGDRY